MKIELINHLSYSPERLSALRKLRNRNLKLFKRRPELFVCRIDLDKCFEKIKFKQNNP